jgi:hypothetical protein
MCCFLRIFGIRDVDPPQSVRIPRNEIEVAVFAKPRWAVGVVLGSTSSSQSLVQSFCVGYEKCDMTLGFLVFDVHDAHVAIGARNIHRRPGQVASGTIFAACVFPQA